MFGHKQPTIKSLISPGCAIEGNVVFQDGLRLDGELRGNVLGRPGSASILVVSESATVHGEIEADHVIVNGAVHGPVRARVMLELQPKARVLGDVTYQALEMHQGALVNGRLCPMQDAAASVVPAAPQVSD
ncbi:bactofilin family protein [Candidatus Symbiobacter mobilis]|uniref:Cell shape determination protein CcmA n=1 Tax=Candidatus Symbiobacter mobilis CR TaxID=946483 RepID=U5NAV0_9BURK|nr:polymer-forming cytoskeletal protein [Candidatus Symbiobacter mobilis]AGX87348.1 cell shape determination protein CcmA [Candidatus Symbiobacter mobilis CR]